MFDTKSKIDRWGNVQIPEALIDEYAGRILAKVVVRRPHQAEEEAQRQAEASRRAEVLRKMKEEATRKAGEDARRLAEELRIAEACLQEEVARKAEANAARKAEIPPMRTRFSSLAELLEDMHTKGGRDPFVADLAKNHGSTNYNNGDNDGVIYIIICLIDLNIYVGQTTSFDHRMNEHLSGNGGSECLTSAINKYGRDNFVSVILLAGIEQQEELDST